MSVKTNIDFDPLLYFGPLSLWGTVLEYLDRDENCEIWPVFQNYECWKNIVAHELAPLVKENFLSIANAYFSSGLKVFADVTWYNTSIENARLQSISATAAFLYPRSNTVLAKGQNTVVTIGSILGLIMLWKPGKERPEKAFKPSFLGQGDAVSKLVLSDDGSFFVACSKKGFFYQSLNGPSTGKLETGCTLDDSQREIYLCGKKVTVLDGSTGEEPLTMNQFSLDEESDRFPLHTEESCVENPMLFQKERNCLFHKAQDTVQMWDLTTMERITICNKAHSDIAFSAKGDILTILDLRSGDLLFWNSKTLEPIAGIRFLSKITQRKQSDETLYLLKDAPAEENVLAAKE